MFYKWLDNPLRRIPYRPSQAKKGFPLQPRPQTRRYLAGFIVAWHLHALLGVAPASAAPAPVVAAPAQSLQLSGDDLEVLIDPTSELSVERLADLKGDTSTLPGLGPWQSAASSPLTIKSGSSLWLRFRLHCADACPLVVSMAWNVPLKSATLLWSEEGRIHVQQPFRLSASAFTVMANRGTHEFLIHLEQVRSRVINPTVTVHNALAPTTIEAKPAQLKSLLYGIVLAMVVLNLGLFTFYRHAYFLYYIFYSLSMFGILAIGSHHLPNAHPWLFRGLVMTNGIAVWLLATSVLEIRTLARRLHRALTATTGIFVGLLAIEMVLEVDTYYYVPAVLVNVLATTAALVRWRQGFKPAGFLVAGWAAFAVGFAINAFGLVSSASGLLMQSAYFGFACEMVLFAFGIGYKARLTEVAITMENQHAFRQLAKVFYPHQILRIRGGEELEHTMPTGQAEACVLCFDIVDSSKIQHEKAKDFFQNVFRRCNEIMIENYDPDKLMANAYRIKEMGDGFICSVGYPFQSPTGFMARDAVQLAYRFHAALCREVELLDYHHPIHCCISVVMGMISGFYPEAGTKTYDMYGRGIILATRYESMRKTVFSGGMTGSAIILQSRVFLSLDDQQRQKFTRFSLRDHKIQVRDDAAAEDLFYVTLGLGSQRVESRPPTLILQRGA